MKPSISLTLWLAVPLAGCFPTGQAVEPFRPAEILSNMPVNSDLRCTGISLVAEALLEGELVPGKECDRPEDLARTIFENAGRKASVRYRAQLCLENRSAPIQSREALDRLSTAVANLYKQRHLELVATEEGKRRIVAGQQAMVRTTRELEAILDADRDKIHAFMVIGIRQFPDASEKPTYHVVLIAKGADGTKVIFDPNDPGAAIDCQMAETDEGLFVKWTCKYRDTGQVTTQEYQIVDRERFFRLAIQG